MSPISHVDERGEVTAAAAAAAAAANIAVDDDAVGAFHGTPRAVRVNAREREGRNVQNNSEHLLSTGNKNVNVRFRARKLKQQAANELTNVLPITNVT